LITTTQASSNQHDVTGSKLGRATAILFILKASQAELHG
jgi:hypothetical protein